MPDLDFTRILKEFELIGWMKERIVPNSGEDDLILEIVVFIGTCASDESGMQSFNSQYIIDLLLYTKYFCLFVLDTFFY